MVAVYSRSANILTYKCAACSQATFFLIALYAAVIILPGLVVYNSHGLWRRLDVFSEQPKIDFKKDFILLLDTLNGDVIFTSRPQKGRLGSDVPLIRFMHSPTDSNLDLRPERHDFRITVNAANITGIRLLLKMEARIQTIGGVASDCLLYLEHSSRSIGSSLSTTSDLRVKSSFVIPFRSKSDLRASPDFTQPFEEILEEHSKSRVKCALEATTKIWRPTTTLPSTPGPFTLSLRVNTAEQPFSYRPGLSYILKIAWMQYFSIMIIFAGLAAKLKKDYRIVSTHFRVKGLSPGGNLRPNGTTYSLWSKCLAWNSTDLFKATPSKLDHNATTSL